MPDERQPDARSLDPLEANRASRSLEATDVANRAPGDFFWALICCDQQIGLNRCST
jgi:hypothetical protein